MACLVSLCSFFTSPKTPFKDIEAQRTYSCRLHLSSSTFLNGVFVACNSRGEELFPLKRHHNPVVAVFHDYDVFCTPRVISGFWIGPDIEDGWGFVEAIVNQMFDV